MLNATVNKARETKAAKAKAKADAQASEQAAIAATVETLAPVAPATDAIAQLQADHDAAQADAATDATATDAATDAPAPVETAPATVSPRQAAKAAHDAAGFFGRVYTGLSKTRNADIAKAPNLATSKAAPRTDAQLTDRMRATLRDLSTRYAFESFPLIGIDRGQAAIFLASGMLQQSGETRATLSNDVLSRYAPHHG